MSAISPVENKTATMNPGQCEACKLDNQLGRRVFLFKKIRLNVATDDLVIFGYVQCFGRLIPLLLLGMVLSILQYINIVENGNAKILNSNNMMFGISLAVIVLFVVVSINALAYLMLGTQSCRGTIRDNNESPSRRFVVPIIYFLIMFSILELVLLVFTIGLVGYDNNISFDINWTDLLKSISTVIECLTNGQVDQECTTKSIRKQNGIILIILKVQLILFLVNGLFKILYYTELLLWLTKFFHKCMKIVCCCCRGKLSLLEEVGELMEAVVVKDSYVTTIHAWLCMSNTIISCL